MVKLDIVTGFLGAGKTTLINRLLAEAYVGEKPVLIENEFGDVSIDDNLIENPDVQVRTLSSGCICCTLKGDFIEGIIEVVERYSPTRIIIEPTGLADPDDILSLCKTASETVSAELNAFITVANAKNLLPLLMVGGELFHKQISKAALLLLNRTSSLSSEELAETLNEVKRLNPDCVIVEQDKEESDPLSIMALAEEATNPCSVRENTDSGHDEHNYCEHNHHHNDGIEDIASLAFYPENTFSQKDLNNLFAAFSENKNGLILRAKGFLRNPDNRFVHFDYVYGQGKVTGSVYNGCPKLVVIGVRMDEQALANLLGGK